MADPDRERVLIRQLDLLQREYRLRAEPIIDELVEIANRKPPAPLVFTAEQLEALGIDITKFKQHTKDC